MRGIGRSWLLGAVVASCGACSTVAPMPPRFVVLAEQEHHRCRIQVLKDTRSPACFLVVQCGRPVTVTRVGPEVCVP